VPTLEAIDDSARWGGGVAKDSIPGFSRSWIDRADDFSRDRVRHRDPVAAIAGGVERAALVCLARVVEGDSSRIRDERRFVLVLDPHAPSWKNEAVSAD
jgi:hypothetical protein